LRNGGANGVGGLRAQCPGEAFDGAFRIVGQWRHLCMSGDRNEVQSVIRACSLLRAFRYKGEVLGLAELAERTGLCKTTVFRLMRSLARGGLAECVEKGGYRGLAAPQASHTVRLGFAAQTDSEFSREVTQGMERAAAREGVHLITVNNRYRPMSGWRRSSRRSFSKPASP
jgi:DNA-binding IclR family transcriptional regulator